MQESSAPPLPPSIVSYGRTHGLAGSGCASPVISSKVGGDDVVDSNVLLYCSIDKKHMKTIGELEQDCIEYTTIFLPEPHPLGYGKCVDLKSLKLALTSIYPTT